MLVKIAPLGERVVEVNVENGTSVEECLSVGGVMYNGRAIKINNQDADLTTQVTGEGAIIVLAQKMKGGR